METFNVPRKTPAAAEAIRHLEALCKYVISVQLPQLNLTQEIKLQNYQQDITSDPKKVGYMFFILFTRGKERVGRKRGLAL